MFKQTGITDEQLIDIILKKESIKDFLLDIQNEWRSMRAISKDPEDKLLIGSECIDEIIYRIDNAEQIRKAYQQQKKEMEEAEKNQ